jgi:preprotein translocase subunit SecY
MIFLTKMQKFFSYPDLRKKVFAMLFLIIFIRVLAHIPLPGIDIQALKQFFNQNQLFGLLNMFSGGTMENFSIVLMGVGPYITASIVIQLLATIIPSLEALSKEGEQGERRKNMYVRWLTVPLALIQSYAMITLLTKGTGGINVIPGGLTSTNLLIALIVTMAGTMFLMWLGEIMSEIGFGNGISLIITIGIIAGFPTMVRNTIAVVFTGAAVDWNKVISLIIFVIIFIIVIASIVVTNEAVRKIPVSYARQARGMTNFGRVDSHIPMRITQAGVMPIIFALALMLFPTTLANLLQGSNIQWVSSSSQWIIANLNQGTFLYGLFYFLLVFGFTFFYTSIVFNPKQVAENLQKRGGFIPGVRPGRETEIYLKTLISRINLFGGIFLAIIAILPFIVQNIVKIDTLYLGGTGILIIVSVVLETMRQIRAQYLMRSYEY